MKIYTSTLVIAGLAILLTGCETPEGTPDNTASGALTGGAVGAISGAAIGGPRNGGAGALIGAAVGALAGGTIGHSMDLDQQARLRAQAPQTYVRVDQGQPLSTTDIKALAKAGVSDDVIISQIRNSHTIFHLSTSDIIDLHSSGVNERVIDFMINTPSLVGGTSQAAPASQTTTYVTVPPPPPPVERVVIAPAPGYVWIDGEWLWDGRWVWMGGYWGVPPYPHAVWVRGTWDRGSHGWHGTRGHWR
ncbi:MAG: YXWGXW repeat-containing protein [Verrucomicrobiota bacterium]|jgi:outer membrane lipoprotein SlyB